MYFNDKNNTDINDKFEKENILSRLLKLLNKYKTIIIIGVILIIGIIIILTFFNKKSMIATNYLILNGEENIILYQGSDYVEPGFDAYNSKNENLSNEVEIKSSLNTSKIGEYEITYTIGNITKTRKINVIAKPDDYAYIYLKTVNNSVNAYVKLNETYTEPGYQVFSSTGEDLTSKVKVTGSVDTSKKGNYKLNYSVVDSNGVTVSASRTVIVMDTEISLSLSTEDYTNKEVTISIGIADNYFDYMLLPDDTRVMESTYEYKVSENGKYTFKVYNTKGVEKEASIEVKNIDKIVPTGSCTVDQNQNGSFITVTASDESGIKKYEYNGKSYTNSKISLTTFINGANVIVYDNANNSKEISCTVVPKVYISNINKDGVIVTINAKKVNSDISGYYFSYTNKRPDKNGGYLATNKESIDVVRLPGTTYVWVEDKSGKISEPKTIIISNDELLITKENGYTILKNPTLEKYLSNQGWSIEELNNLMARSVRAAGLYSKEAAATSALSLLHVLAQKYKIKLPYESAGIYTKVGAKPSWGGSGYNYITETSVYYGMDCSAFINWAYANAGYGINSRAFFWGGMSRVDFTKENGEIGDILVYGYGEQAGRHVKLIVGKTETAFIVAEASSGTNGIVISTHPYSNPNGYKIEKSTNLTDLSKNTGYYKLTDYPSGF